ncbi:hypothetical protein CK203_080158 [Vitis vinifera]|uniref:Reverse transcriptase domain-containing protein n=1 Tax=Vitis vinifera TaxID=29760 RepID=A0A438F2V0_VITVI|nr:hypothetical protein CK203_080158 [Vitis vinifera]
MGKVVSNSQNAFVGGRQILDAVLVAKEAIDSRKRSIGVVLVNGTPTEFFSTFRDLRQGNPLSPYLFVLIMEAFSSLISRAEEKGFIRVSRIATHNSAVMADLWGRQGGGGRGWEVL